MANLPLAIFPGFTSYGLVSDAVKEIATVFNAEGVDALQSIPESMVAWADVGTRVTRITVGQGKIPVRLTSLLGFEPFAGERTYHPLSVAAVTVKVDPWSLGLEWPIQLTQAGAPAGLVDFYGISGVANDVVEHARALKADLAASILIGGLTNSSLSMTATALTLPQPGLSSGLPLFSDGSTSGSSKHYSNPLDSSSTKFSNLSLNAGKITDTGVWGQCLLDMTQVPHPSKANMTMGLGVTDVIGGTNMLIPFWQLAQQTLSMQISGTLGSGGVGAATTNVLTPDMLAKASAMIGVSGLTPWRFWIAPQLDAHPYIVAHPTYQMWYTVSRTRKAAAWGELGGPSDTFVPQITLLGDGTEEARKSRKVRLFGDIDGGGAAGLPHFIHQYLETTP